MAKDVYYFSHDANSQDDPKCMVLIDQLGMEGYGIFWALIEKLRSASGYKLPVSISGSLSKRWGTSKEKVQAVIENYNLFQLTEDNDFFSERLIHSMELKSLKARESANKRWNKDANAMQPYANALQSHTNAMRTDAIKGKESKGKESKGNNILERKLSFSETLKPFLNNPYSKEMLNDFYLYWTETTRSGNKFRQELQTTWDISRRLSTWSNNNFGNKKTAENENSITKIKIGKQC
jgi:hypothetical protein